MAVVVVGHLLALAARLLRSPGLRGWGSLLGALVLVQFGLGIANVVMSLPLHVAVTHNAGATALLFVLVTLLARLRAHPTHDRDRLARFAVLGADQAAGGRADRVHRDHRHAAGDPAGRCVAMVAPAGRQHRHLAGGGERGGDQPPAGPAHRQGDGAHRRSSARHRHAATRAGAGLRGRPRGRVDGDPAAVGERGVRGADLRLADRLRDRLHRLAEARDPAEHRHRRHRRGGAAAARLGRGHRHAGRVGLGACAAAGADHLRVDAAALLGAGDLPPRRLRARAGADAAGHPRRPLHALADPAVRCCWWWPRCCRGWRT